MSSFPCPKCGADTKVVDSRPTHEHRLRRRRACVLIPCGHRFTTYEVEASVLEQAKATRGARSILTAVIGQLDRLRDTLPADSTEKD